MSADNILVIAASELVAVRFERNSYRTALVAIKDMAHFNADSAYWLPVIRELARKTLEPK